MQMRGFDADQRLNKVWARGDPLVTIESVVPRDDFHSDIELTSLTLHKNKKRKTGCKPIDCLI